MPGCPAVRPQVALFPLLNSKKPLTPRPLTATRWSMLTRSPAPSYELRFGVATDLAEVAVLFNSHYRSELTSQDPESATRLMRELSGIHDGTTILIVACAHGAIIGAGLAVTNRDFAEYEGAQIRKTGYLSKNVVHRDFRGRGIGRSLVEARVNQLRDRGIDVAYSSHHADNLASAKALDACGFEYVATFPDPEKRPTGSGMTVVRRLVCGRWRSHVTQE